MNEVDADSRLCARSDLAAVELDGEAVIYDDANRRLHRLNAPATILWNCLDGAASLRQIAGDIAETLGADATSVLSDIVTVAKQLVAEGLLESSQPSPSQS